ncbi:MAG: hypothetical protein HY904_15920 [Deltaproteobacteria bacterium]|nr:hypothetical protein [Deltaproteobacteria bacterium]
MEDLHARFPDYLFARTEAAKRMIRRGDLAGAREKLAPVRALPRLHVTEYAALCSAEVELLLADGDRAGAERRLDIWEQTCGESPLLTAAREQLHPDELVERLRGALGL